MADEVRASLKDPQVTVPSALFYGALLLWVIFTQAVPVGRALYASLLLSRTCCSGNYGLFFSVAGGVAIALWISVFAVLALSKYAPTSDPKPFLARVLATRDILFNAWMVDRLATIHELFATVVIICGAMLMPQPSLAILIVAAIAAIVIGAAARLTAKAYLRIATDHNTWLNDEARPRFERVMSQLKKRHGAVVLRRRLIAKLRPVQRQIVALQGALKINPGATMAVDMTVKAAILTLPYDQSPMLSAYTAALLIAIGMGLVFRIAVQLVVDIPEAVQGRQVPDLRQLLLGSVRRNPKAPS